MIAKLFSSKNRDLVVVLILLLILICLYHVGTALLGHARYRDQHLGAALHYAATQFDLKHTIIPGFNATGTPTILELPIWQMAAGLAFKHISPWWGWANIVSLLLFLNCLYPLYRIAHQFYGERVAWWTLIMFLSQALIFIFAGEAGTDGFSLSISLWFWFACCKLLDNPVPWFFPAAVLGAVTAVTKLPFFMAVGWASLFLLLKQRGFNLRYLAALAGVGTVAGVSFLCWTHYTDTVQNGAEFQFFDLRLSNPDMVFWYFGDWHYRLNPANWIKSGWRFANVTFGSFSLIALFVFALINRRIHPAAKFFFIGGILTTLVFTHLILHHYHYLMIFAPAVAILSATTISVIESFLLTFGFKARSMTCVAAVILFAGLFQGLMSLRAFSFDYFPRLITAAIQNHTTAQDKLVVVNGGWGGDELIRAGRTGLSLWDAKTFDNTNNYARLKELGYNKLVILSESPFQNAIEIVNPGQTGIPRIMAKVFLTPLIEKWPAIYTTDDIIIKDIP
jgi:hypothetical protein